MAFHRRDGRPYEYLASPARALPGILPALTVVEALEVTHIDSAADMLPRPDEVTLTHRSVLFLDERRMSCEPASPV